MKLPSRKLLSLILAILLGAGIIFFAWRTVSFQGSTTASGETETDVLTDNGSWRDALKVIPQNSLTRLLGANAGSASSTMATTTTALLGRELLMSYALAQKSIGDTPMTDADAQVIADILAGKVMKDTTVKTYTEKELTLVAVNTASLNTYQKALVAAFDKFSNKNTANELKIVLEAVQQRDAAKLAPLANTVKNLQTLLNTLRAMKVPRDVATLHIFFLDNYTLILSGVTDMQKIVDDPVLGIRGVAKYREGMNAITYLGELMKASR